MNYAEVAYYLRGQLSHETEEFLVEQFSESQNKDVEIPIERLVNVYTGKKRDSFQEAINIYCKFQGIDDGVFTQDDYVDFFGFLYSYFDNDGSFKKYVLNPSES